MSSRGEHAKITVIVLPAASRREPWPTPYRIVLASASPRRSALMESIGLSFATRPAQIDEKAFQAPTPALLAERLAAAKAEWVARRLAAGDRPAIVIGVDTIVFVDGEVLGKPQDADCARAMLAKLSGRAHDVISGLACVICPAPGRTPVGRGHSGFSTLLVEHERTRVVFRRLSQAAIERYVATGEPLDKAGAYGIQERGAVLVERIEGCYFNVVGLPLARMAGMLERFGIQLP